MPSGYVQVRVFTSRALIPLEGANVAVTIQGEGAEVLAGVRVTNSEGQINEIEIETPALINSTEPFQAQGFATCNIRVEHVGYYTVLIRNAQVFPSVTTLQNVEMIPISENAPETERLKTIFVTAQNL